MNKSKTRYVMIFLLLIALLLPATLIMHGAMSKERKLQPTITLKGKEEVVIKEGEKFREPGYEAKDGLGNDISFAVRTSTPKLDGPGDYEIRYYVKDKHGNAVWTARKITVVAKDKADENE